jgi:hypothetical protein
MKLKHLILAAGALGAVAAITVSQRAGHLMPQATAMQQTDAVYGELLGKYLSERADGVVLVDYAKWSASKGDVDSLKGYVLGLAALKPSQMRREEAFAYWANLYNAITLQVILENYPVKSIKDIKSTGTSLFDVKAFFGPWRTKRVTVEGKELSLDDIEHSIMRPTFKDPRVHYAVNCASIGCPNLKRTPWSAETLEADLEAGAKAFVNHPRGVTANADGSLTVSSIYTWFKEDFGGSDDGVIAHLRRYAGPELAETLKGSPRISGNEYDWSLNAPAPKS